MPVRLLTLATPSTLPQARVLADSLRRHQPDWPLEVLFVGRERETDAAVQRLPLRSVADELDLDIESLIARYDEEDLIALLLPLVLRSYSALAPAPSSICRPRPGCWATSLRCRRRSNRAACCSSRG